MTIVLGCAAGAASAAAAGSPQLVSYHRFQGSETLALTVAADGHARASFTDAIARSHRSARFALGPGALGRLRHDIRAAGFARLARSYRGPAPVACGVEQHVRAARRTVVVVTGGRPQRALARLLSELEALAARHTATIAGARGRAALC